MCRKVLKEFFLGWEYATDKKKYNILSFKHFDFLPTLRLIVE